MRKAAANWGGSGGTPGVAPQMGVETAHQGSQIVEMLVQAEAAQLPAAAPCTIFRVPRRVRSRMLKAMRHGPSGVCSTSACPWSESENPGRIARQAQQIRKTGACYM